MFLRILDCVGRAARILRQIADADAAAVYHVAVTALHTAPVIMLCQTNHLVGRAFYMLTPCLFLRTLPFRLSLVGHDNDKANIGMHLAALNHGLRREGVKASRTPSIKYGYRVFGI